MIVSLSRQILRVLSRLRFSLGQLFAITAVVAISIALWIATRKQADLQAKHQSLQPLSNELEVENPDRLQEKTLPKIAWEFDSWLIHVPKNQKHEIYFAAGICNADCFPEEIQSISLSSGQHRITLHSINDDEGEYRFDVYVDGQLTISQSMDESWMPHGSSGNRGITLTPDLRGRKTAATNKQMPLQLVGKIYTPKLQFNAKGDYNQSLNDDSISSPGYRLWVDVADAVYLPSSPLVGFPENGKIRSIIGWRDGLRLSVRGQQSDDLHFTFPAARSEGTLLKIIPAFWSGDSVVHSSTSKTIKSWSIRDDAQSDNPLRWRRDQSQKIYTAFLHASPSAKTTINPVIELQWNFERPSAIGIRLAETPANQSLTKWQLRIVEGTRHLWQSIQVNQRQIKVAELAMDNSTQSTGQFIPIEPQTTGTDPLKFSWQTDIEHPLQLLTSAFGKPSSYAGMNLYQGLPIGFSIETEPNNRPSISVSYQGQIPNASATPIPDGPVVDEIKIELDATRRDWIWIESHLKTSINDS